MLYKKVFLKISQIYRKTCDGVSFVIKLQAESFLHASGFPVNFPKFFKKPFL